MPFVYPLYLLGALAAGIPIIIHMIHKRKAPRVLFPTLRFLKASNERTSRRQKIQDLLLLLLRVLLFVLLALALAQPFLGSRRWGFGERIHAVIVLDNSYSMGTEHERVARLKAAKNLATAAVEALPAKASQAAVLLAFPPFGHPKPLLTNDREKLRRDILKAPLSQGKADLTAALQRAYDLLAEDDNKAPTMEIYVVTDLQRNSWSPPQPLEKRHKNPKPHVIVVDCGRTDYRNLAVTELIVHGGARVRGRPITLQARIRNYNRSKADATVALYVGQAKQDSQTLQIPPDLTVTASFNTTFAEPGVHSGWIQIGDDSLAIDNRRDFCIDIQDHVPALVLRESAGGIPQLDPAFFVAKALDPFGDDPSKPRSLVQTTVMDFSNLTHEVLKSYRVVVLMDIGGLRKDQIAVLRQYVRRGGRLMIFLGPNLRTKSLNDFLNADPPENAPMPLTVNEPQQGLVDRTKFRSLIGIDHDHPALHVFKGYRLPSTVKVYNAAPIDVPQNSPTRILIGMSDGNPFLLENRFHEGRVILCATCTDPDWSNLAASRFFLPLVHRLVYYLTEREDVEGTHIVGAPVSITLRDVNRPVAIQVRDPSGDVADIKAAPSGGATRASFPHTGERGPYTYMVLDPARKTESPRAVGADIESGFVVNLDSQESDLAPFGDPADPGTRAAELERLLDGHLVHYVGPPEQASADALKAAVAKIRQGIPLRNLFLYIVLFIAIFETFFANRVVPALQAAEERAGAPHPGTAPATSG